jgi:NodT family efflux transporter outer membrane factor (OMF) lipoprotein
MMPSPLTCSFSSDFKHRGILFSLVLLLSGCDMGPNYTKPTLEFPQNFKHIPIEWKKATLDQPPFRGSWWSLFNDPALDTLQLSLKASNQTIAAAAFRYRAAEAQIKQKLAAYYPNLGTSSTITRQQSATSVSQGASKLSNQYNIGLSSSWEFDLFNKIGKDEEVSLYGAQAEAAALAGVELSEQALLAQSYFQIKVADLQTAALKRQKEAYTRLLRITENKYAAGVVGKKDVLQAKQQLESLESSLLDTEITRTQFENSIATLVGTPASFFNLPSNTLRPKVPSIPQTLPSVLLERRPDVKQAERLVAQANSEVGLEKTAYFPSVTLGLSGGFQSSKFYEWFTIPSRFWSIGPTVLHTVFDGGYRDARVEGAEYTYDQMVAQYKEIVLAAFQEVEDQLITLHSLRKAYDLQEQASKHAREALVIITNQYEAGIVSYSDVLVSQNAASTTELATLDILSRLMVAVVNYVKAIGGRW